MSDLKLFRIENGTAVELIGTALALEKPLQVLIENNMEALFGVRPLASEYSTGKKHGGRIDSLGMDENGAPVIFEYKRSINENVINQGLFYLDWLMDHRGEFELLVIKTLGLTEQDQIDWSSPRLVCVASDFTRYDGYAIAQIDRNIDLVRYRDYDGAYLTLDLMASTSASATSAGSQEGTGKAAVSTSDRTVLQLHQRAPKELRDLYDSLESYLLALGDDVTKTVRKNYYAFRRIKNFACVEVHPQARKLLVYLKADPSNVVPQSGFTRDVSGIGHFGTGNLEVTISNRQNLELAQSLILASYQTS